MDSLPPEFLSHLTPLLFFAGINPNPSAPAASSSPETPARPDPFEGLLSNLRSVLVPKQTSSLVWNPRKPHQTVPEFRVLLVDKAVRFPPRKTRPTSSTSTIPHSPLSPLSLTSPLFPDGLISPIWIRKHRDMIPSIFVLVLQLWQPSSIRGSHDALGRPLSSQNLDEHEIEQQKTEDYQLIHEIIERKRATSEHSIKLTVVILTSREMLDDPTLDYRLGYIRKQSGLDSRASLFVLSPVPKNDVIEFINTLKAELYETSIDYYREHSRRVRRKRSRSTSNASVHSTIYHQPGQPVTPPLGPQGWSVRADYKLATFAEFRQEFEVALKSYEDCWEGLCQMFSSTATLPPRTKRWAEAKVLIDCVSLKICKLYLYSNESSRAMHQFNKHIHKFRDLCSGWGIGDDTYGFWAWLSKQYTILGDLVDIACRSGMRLSSFLPIQTSPANNRFSTDSAQSVASNRGLAGGALNPSNVLLHPGFYYFQSAQCSVERRTKFLASEAAEDEMRAIAESKGEGALFQPSPALSHERKINHAELIIGLFTKSYEIFKTVGANRMTLFIALKMASIHFETKNFEISLKFLERLLTSYRKDHFYPITEVILSTYNHCLKQALSDSASSSTTSELTHTRLGRLLESSFELIAERSYFISEERQIEICGHISELLKATSPDAAAMSLDLSQTKCPVESRVIFWKSWIEFGEEIEFQVIIKFKEMFSRCNILLDSIKFKFSSLPLISLEHETSEDLSPFRVFKLGTVLPNPTTLKFDLETRNDSIFVVTGRLKPSEIGILSLEQVKLGIKGTMDGPLVELITRPVLNQEGAISQLRWFRDFDRDSKTPLYLNTEPLHAICNVEPKHARFNINLINVLNALTDEEQVIEMVIENEEEIDIIGVKIDLELESTFSGDAIAFEDQTSDSSLGSLDLGHMEAKATMRRALRFLPSDASGSRKIKITAKAQIHSSSTSGSEGEQEKLDRTYPVTPISRSIYVDVINPFEIDFKLRYIHQRQHDHTHQIFHLGQADIWARSSRAILTITVQGNSKTKLFLTNIELMCKTSVCPIRVCSNSITRNSDSGSNCSIGLMEGKKFGVSYVIELVPGYDDDLIVGNFLALTWTRKPDDPTLSCHVKKIPLELNPPLRQMVTVLTNLPVQLDLYQKFEISYLIQNRDVYQTMDLSIQIDPSDQWVFSGPRKIQRLLILPGSQRIFKLLAVPVMIGEIEGPNIKVIERIYKHRRETKGKMSLLVSEIESMMIDEDCIEEDKQEDLVQLKEVDIVRELSCYDPDRSLSTPSLTRNKKLKVKILPS